MIRDVDDSTVERESVRVDEPADLRRPAVCSDHAAAPGGEVVAARIRDKFWRDEFELGVVHLPFVRVKSDYLCHEGGPAVFADGVLQSCPRPQITVVELGRSVAIECKAARGAQRETQKRWQAAFEKAGGVYLISRDAETVCASLTAAMSKTAAQKCDTA